MTPEQLVPLQRYLDERFGRVDDKQTTSAQKVERLEGKVDLMAQHITELMADDREDDARDQERHSRSVKWMAAVGLLLSCLSNAGLIVFGIIK